MRLFAVPRLRSPLAGGRWLTPSAELLLVDALAVVIGIVGELSLLYDDGSPVRPVPVILTVVAGAALFGRRRYPVLVLVAMLAATGALFVLGESPGGVLVCVSLFSVAERCRTWVSVLALVGATAVLVALSVTSVPPPVAAWAAGAVLRSRRQRRDEAQALAAAARVEQEQRAAIAAHEERAAIARELHDIVAHSVTVMLVGVRGARDVLRTEPDVAADVLSRVETSGEHSMAELRRLLSALRGVTPSAQAAAPSRPVPGLGDLPSLVAGFGSVGLHVHLECADLAVVEEGVGLSVYRIVEEALTNVVRHAATSDVVVRLTTSPDQIVVEVSDRGVDPSDAESSGGHGLAGMRERARLLGGDLSAGPAPDGGFLVVARLPLREAP